MELIDEIIEENRKLKEQNQVLKDAAQKYGWGIQYAIVSLIAKAGNRAVLQVLDMKTMRIEMIGIQVNNDGTITSPITETTANENSLDWDEAKAHLDYYAEEYRKLNPIVGTFGLVKITDLLDRYEKGERTRYLYDEIMAIE